MILWNGINIAVGTGVKLNDAGIVVVQINSVIGSNEIVKLEQNIVFHVHLNSVGMGPEHVRHLSAGSTGLQKRPVVIPVNNLNLDGNAGDRRPFIGDLLETGLLVGVPDVDGQAVNRVVATEVNFDRSVISGSTAGAAAGDQRECHNERQHERRHLFQFHVCSSFKNFSLASNCIRTATLPLFYYDIE